MTYTLQCCVKNQSNGTLYIPLLFDYAHVYECTYVRRYKQISLSKQVLLNRKIYTLKIHIHIINTPCVLSKKKIKILGQEKTHQNEPNHPQNPMGLENTT